MSDVSGGAITLPGYPVAGCAYCRAVSAGTPPVEALVCGCAVPCGAGRCRARPLPVAGRWAAGRVSSGPGAAYVHVITLLGGDVWVTACSADHYGPGEPPRHTRSVLEPVDCPDCVEAEPDIAEEVNRRLADRMAHEATVRELVEDFIRWAAEQHPAEGGVVLAFYGGTRLYAMRPDERDRAVQLWLESRRS